MASPGSSATRGVWAGPRIYLGAYSLRSGRERRAEVGVGSTSVRKVKAIYVYTGWPRASARDFVVLRVALVAMLSHERGARQS